MDVNTFRLATKPNSPQCPQNKQSQSAPMSPNQDSPSKDFSTNRDNIFMQTAKASVLNLEKS